MLMHQIPEHVQMLSLVTDLLLLQRTVLKHMRKYLIDVLWCQPIKLIQVVSTSEFHEY